MERIRKNFPFVPLILGGIYACFCPKHVRFSGADFIHTHPMDFNFVTPAMDPCDGAKYAVRQTSESEEHSPVPRIPFFKEAVRTIPELRTKPLLSNKTVYVSFISIQFSPRGDAAAQKSRQVINKRTYRKKRGYIFGPKELKNVPF